MESGLRKHAGVLEPAEPAGGPLGLSRRFAAFSQEILDRYAIWEKYPWSSAVIRFLEMAEQEEAQEKKEPSSFFVTVELLKVYLQRSREAGRAPGQDAAAGPDQELVQKLQEQLELLKERYDRCYGILERLYREGRQMPEEEFGRIWTAVEKELELRETLRERDGGKKPSYSPFDGARRLRTGIQPQSIGSAWQRMHRLTESHSHLPDSKELFQNSVRRQQQKFYAGIVKDYVAQETALQAEKKLGRGLQSSERQAIMDYADGLGRAQLAFYAGSRDARVYEETAAAVLKQLGTVLETDRPEPGRRETSTPGDRPQREGQKEEPRPGRAGVVRQAAEEGRPGRGTLAGQPEHRMLQAGQPEHGMLQAGQTAAGGSQTGSEMTSAGQPGPQAAQAAQAESQRPETEHPSGAEAGTGQKERGIGPAETGQARTHGSQIETSKGRAETERVQAETSEGHAETSGGQTEAARPLPTFAAGEMFRLWQEKQGADPLPSEGMQGEGAAQGLFPGHGPFVSQPGSAGPEEGLPDVRLVWNEPAAENPQGEDKGLGFAESSKPASGEPKTSSPSANQERGREPEAGELRAQWEALRQLLAQMEVPDQEAPEAVPRPVAADAGQHPQPGQAALHAGNLASSDEEAFGQGFLPGQGDRALEGGFDRMALVYREGQEPSEQALGHANAESRPGAKKDIGTEAQRRENSSREAGVQETQRRAGGPQEAMPQGLQEKAMPQGFREMEAWSQAAQGQATRGQGQAAQGQAVQSQAARGQAAIELSPGQRPVNGNMAGQLSSLGREAASWLGTEEIHKGPAGFLGSLYAGHMAAEGKTVPSQSPAGRTSHSFFLRAGEPQGRELVYRIEASGTQPVDRDPVSPYEESRHFLGSAENEDRPERGNDSRKEKRKKLEKTGERQEETGEASEAGKIKPSGLPENIRRAAALPGYEKDWELYAQETGAQPEPQSQPAGSSLRRIALEDGMGLSPLSRGTPLVYYEGGKAGAEAEGMDRGRGKAPLRQPAAPEGNPPVASRGQNQAGKPSTEAGRSQNQAGELSVGAGRNQNQASGSSTEASRNQPQIGRASTETGRSQSQPEGRPAGSGQRLQTGTGQQQLGPLLALWGRPLHLAVLRAASPAQRQYQAMRVIGPVPQALRAAAAILGPAGEVTMGEGQAEPGTLKRPAGQGTSYGQTGQGTSEGQNVETLAARLIYRLPEAVLDQISEEASREFPEAARGPRPLDVKELWERADQASRRRILQIADRTLQHLAGGRPSVGERQGLVSRRAAQEPASEQPAGSFWREEQLPEPLLYEALNWLGPRGQNLTPEGPEIGAALRHGNSMIGRSQLEFLNPAGAAGYPNFQAEELYLPYVGERGSIVYASREPKAPKPQEQQEKSPAILELETRITKQEYIMQQDQIEMRELQRKLEKQEKQLQVSQDQMQSTKRSGPLPREIADKIKEQLRLDRIRYGID